SVEQFPALQVGGTLWGITRENLRLQAGLRGSGSVRIDHRTASSQWPNGFKACYRPSTVSGKRLKTNHLALPAERRCHWRGPAQGGLRALPNAAGFAVGSAKLCGTGRLLLSDRRGLERLLVLWRRPQKGSSRERRDTSRQRIQ